MKDPRDDPGCLQGFISPKDFVPLTILQRLGAVISRSRYPREDSNKRDFEPKNADFAEGEDKIPYTARTESSSPGPEPSPNQDPDLALIQDLWPSLPARVRQAIVAMVRADAGDGDKDIEP